MLSLTRTPPLFCFALAALALSACASSTRTIAASTPACEMSAEDADWIGRSVAAWRFATREIAGFEPPAEMQSVFFDADCVWLSSNALGGEGEPVWSVTAHNGTVTLPNRDEMPAGVTSFSSGDDTGLRFFVMSTPSVWSAGGVPGGELGLDTLMTAVLLHEGSHVAQTPTYGPAIGRLERENNLGEDFNDDSLQRRFANDAAFAASVVRETELFLAAAAATDDAEARRLAREARDLMRARASQYFVGADAFWAEAEDVWLTFEGSAQWLGYHWVIDARGGNRSAADAFPGFGQRSRWWSQKEGFALFMALDRLDGGAWRATVFGDGDKTALELLDEAIMS